MPSPLEKVVESSDLALSAQSATPSRLAEALVALANAAGGRLIVGVDPRTGRPEGLVDPDRVLERALQAALGAEPPLILPMPRFVCSGDTQVLEITVPSGLPHVYAWQGRYLVREGTRIRALAPKVLRHMMLERGAASFECAVPEQACLEDLDWERVERYLTLLSAVPGAAQEQLLRRGCLKTAAGAARPTVAGLLLFGRNPQRWVRSGQILLVRYSGKFMTDRFVKEEIGGTLPDQMRRAEAFVVANMPKDVRLSGLERVEEGAYPLAAVREVIVNAVAHRDYQIQGEETRILLFSDRIECYSPGRLPGHVTLENLVEERFSRNAAIVQVLSDMGFIERLGYGIDRILRLMADSHLPEPRFEETAGGFRVTLFGGAGAPGSADAIRRWRQLGLSDRQERALMHLTERGRITNREYQELCPDVSAETIRRDLADLVNKNLLLRIGDKKATYYILK